MARRKKAPRSVHREAIAAAASRLFQERGTEQVSMDEIARAAGYSKATLYVYFENKEEIIRVLVLESMKKLCACVASSMEAKASTRERYDLICRELLRFQREHPFFFRMTLEAIDVDFEGRTAFPEERETYRTGEEINRMICGILRSGIERGEVREDLELLPASFSCWGMLAGLIQFSENKEVYIRQAMGLDREAFLRVGFALIYRALEAGRGK